jgi:hypothetical protein
MLAAEPLGEGVAMDTAAKILIIGGLVSLLYSFVMAFKLALERQADPMADRHLLLQVHVVSLWEGFMLLGLVWAVRLSDLSSGLETTAALLLVAGGTLQMIGNTMAWRENNTNLFAPPRGMTFQVARLNAFLAFAGLVILVIGAFKGL